MSENPEKDQWSLPTYRDVTQLKFNNIDEEEVSSHRTCAFIHPYLLTPTENFSISHFISTIMFLTWGLSPSFSLIAFLFKIHAFPSRHKESADRDFYRPRGRKMRRVCDYHLWYAFSCLFLLGEFTDVKFYPYTKSGDDPIFAVVNARQVTTYYLQSLPAMTNNW